MSTRIGRILEVCRPLPAGQFCYLKRWRELTVSDLQKELAQGQVRSAYLVEGSSSAERERALKLLEDTVIEPGTRDLCFNVFDGDQSQAAQILETLATVPFIGERRLVYVRRFDHMAADEQQIIADACAKGFGGSVLVLAGESLDRRKKGTKALLESVGLIDITPPQGEALVRWLMAEGERLGIRLEREAAAVMVGEGREQADALVSELEKVAAYVGKGNVATAEDVATVLSDAAPWAAENEIFQLCDATVEGRVAAALSGIDRLVGTGAHPIYIVTMLARHYRRMLAVKSFGSRDAVRADKELGLRSPKFAIERLMRQASRFTQRSIEDGLSLLLEADLSLKRGAEPRTTLERVVVALATMDSPVRS